MVASERPITQWSIRSNPFKWNPSKRETASYLMSGSEEDTDSDEDGPASDSDSDSD